MYESPTIDRLMAMKSVEYAHFSAVGTWVAKRKPCITCGWHWQDYGPPLQVQWEQSGEVIGDFSWDGPFGYIFVVKEHVAESLRAMQFDCRFLPVEYVKPKRKRNTVQFPYEGLKLLWGQCSIGLEPDLAASGVKLECSCSVCGDTRYTFRNNGIYIPRKNWSGQKIFRITTNGRSCATFVSEEGRQLIKRASFSNVSFYEAGQIVE